MRFAVIAMVGMVGCSEPEVARAIDAQSPPDRHHAGPIEYEVRSEYSQIRVRKRGRVRTLLFVDEHGRERVQSKVDLAHPAQLELPYTRMMFASYLVAPTQHRVLIVGLGGGAMVHHLRSIDAALEIDVVELDREVIRVADRLFDVRDGGRVHVHARDAIAWFEAAAPTYEAIYLDAFLGDSPGTDATGAPREVRTTRFLERVRARLSRGGVAVINLHHHYGHEADLNAIRDVFPAVYTLQVPGDGNVIVLAMRDIEHRDQDALRAQAAKLH